MHVWESRCDGDFLPCRVKLNDPCFNNSLFYIQCVYLICPDSPCSAEQTIKWALLMLVRVSWYSSGKPPRTHFLSSPCWADRSASTENTTRIYILLEPPCQRMLIHQGHRKSVKHAILIYTPSTGVAILVRGSTALVIMWLLIFMSRKPRNSLFLPTSYSTWSYMGFM